MPHVIIFAGLYSETNAPCIDSLVMFIKLNQKINLVVHVIPLETASLFLNKLKAA